MPRGGGGGRAWTGGPSVGRRGLLWLLAGRLVLYGALWVSGLLAVESGSGGAPLLRGLGVGLLGATALGLAGLASRAPLVLLAYLQLLVDLLAATGVVHLTGGVGSPFTFLYVLAILEGGLTLVHRGGLFAATFATMAYSGLSLARLTHPDLPLLQIAPFRYSGAPGSHVLWDPMLHVALFYAVAFAMGSLATGLRRAGEELRGLERELGRLRLETHDILTNIPSGILTCDLDGRLVYLNPAGRALLGLEPEGGVGRALEELLGNQLLELLVLFRQGARGGSGVLRGEAMGRKPSGEAIHLGVSVAPLLSAEGARRGATALFQDISGKQRLEELARRTERLQALTEFSAGIAHEIKNPLASIRSSVELLARGRSMGSEDRQLMRCILSESDRLTHLLNGFLHYTRIQVREWRPVAIGDLVRETLLLLRHHPEFPPGVQVVIAGDKAGETVWGDRELLKQVVSNLLLNAGQAIAGEGTITVQYALASAAAGATGDGGVPQVQIAIRDTGPGFPPEVARRLFDPFFTTRKGGTGLGLAIVHRAVEAHGGQIFAESVPGKGADFTLRLPARRPGGAWGEGEPAALAERFHGSAAPHR